MEERGDESEARLPVEQVDLRCCERVLLRLAVVLQSPLARSQVRNRRDARSGPPGESVGMHTSASVYRAEATSKLPWLNTAVPIIFKELS